MLLLEIKIFNYGERWENVYGKILSKNGRINIYDVDYSFNNVIKYMGIWEVIGMKTIRDVLGGWDYRWLGLRLFLCFYLNF